jgi:hypothetical protein
MMNTRKRRISVVAALGLLGASLAAFSPGGIAQAATVTTTNACFSNATATYSDLNWALTGAAAVNPVTIGDPVTLTGGSVGVNIPATLLVAGYNLNLLTVGANSIPTSVWVARQATNATAGAGQTQKGTSVVQVDTFTITATTTITDPDGTPGTGDETATPLAVNQPLPNMTVTSNGNPVKFSQAAPGSLPAFPAGVVATGPVTPNGSLYASASVAGGVIRANFDCQPGTTIISPPGGTSGATFTPATAAAFESVTALSPPTAPVCTNGSASVGVTQTATIDLRPNCTDVNVPPDAVSTNFAVSPLSPAAGSGTLTTTATPGVYSYTAPASDPGPVSFTFTLTDSTGRTSTAATVAITILANQCDATAATCSLTEIVVQPVIGTTMTFDKVAGQVIMSPVVLNGQAQASTGAIQQVTVTNARGTAAPWTVTGYVTDLGVPGLSPTITLPTTGQTIPACTNAGSLSGALGGGNVPDRNCIPGNNLGWAPSAAIAHKVIPGDVAKVTPGAAMMGDSNGDGVPDAAAWLGALINAGTAGGQGAGLGGLQVAHTLCSAPVNQSGGTFNCNAALYLGVPASAGAGNYGGGLVLTLT